ISPALHNWTHQTFRRRSSGRRAGRNFILRPRHLDCRRDHTLRKHSISDWLHLPAGRSGNAPRNYLDARYFSIADVTASLSGVSFELNRATTLPLRSTRNLLKFQVISPPNSPFVFLSVRNLYNGSISWPLADIFATLGKVT